jgi:hypothetical protein
MIFFAGKDDRLQEGDARQIEEWTADGGRWQGRLFSLWGEQTVNESGTNKRIQRPGGRRRTAFCRTGFPARQMMESG